jgi:hypothetical protein
MKNADFVETGFTDLMDFIFVQYSVTNCGLASNNRFPVCVQCLWTDCLHSEPVMSSADPVLGFLTAVCVS